MSVKKRHLRPDSLRLTGFARKDLCDLLAENWTSILSRAPHDIPFDPEIRVNQDVAEGNDPRPWHLWIPGSQFIRRACRRFADDGEFVNYGTPRHF